MEKLKMTPERQAMLKKKSAGWAISLLRGLFLAGVCFTVLYPFLSEFSFSVMSVKDAFNPNTTYIPAHPTLINYQAAMELMDYWRVLWNTFSLSFVTALVQLLSALMVGYGLARYEFKLKNFLFITVIIVMVLPPDLLLLSRFFQFRFFSLPGLPAISLVDTYWPFVILGLTCTGLKNGLYIFMMRQFFLGFPKSIEEAAYVDGAGPMSTFLRVILPSSVSMSVTVFLFSFVWQWNDSIYARVFLTTTKVFTKVSISDTQAALLIGTGATTIAQSLVSNASIVLISLPLIVVYICCQKFFVQSIERSGLVG